MKKQIFTFKLSTASPLSRLPPNPYSSQRQAPSSFLCNKILKFKSFSLSFHPDKHQAEAIFTFSDFLLGNQNINSIMQQARSTFTHRGREWDRKKRCEVIEKTYNDVNLSHSCIKKDVINLSDWSSAKDTTTAKRFLRDTRTNQRTRHKTRPHNTS